jgi:hypothetical protein
MTMTTFPAHMAKEVDRFLGLAAHELRPFYLREATQTTEPTVLVVRWNHGEQHPVWGAKGDYRSFVLTTADALQSEIAGQALRYYQESSDWYGFSNEDIQVVVVVRLPDDTLVVHCRSLDQD